MTDFKEEFEKRLIYVKYMSVALGLRHNFEIYKVGENGWGDPHKTVGSLGLKWLWKDIKIMSYDEWIVAEMYGYNWYKDL